MFSKAGIKEAVLRLSGITAYKWARLPDGLYCFNYHRIGDRHQTQFDPNVFSCTAESFELQLRFFKQHFQLISLAELQQLLDNPDKIKGKYALITFDDGYMDNHERALPILQQEGVSAVFFVSADFVGSETIPWWDQIAWWVRHSKASKIYFGHDSVPIQLRDTASTEQSIRMVLRAVKADPRELEEKLAELKIQLKPTHELPASSTLFMGWAELKHLLDCGMEVGSHTCGHQILSHLSQVEQLRELQDSKQHLEAELSAQVQALAYPVGDDTSFDTVTFDCAAQAGYQLAFSFTNRINHWPIVNPLNISRIGIDNDMSLQALQHKVAWSYRR